MKELSRIEELEGQLDEALASRRAWMEKTIIARAEILRLRGLCEEAARALEARAGKRAFPLEEQKLIRRLRQGAA